MLRKIQPGAERSGSAAVRGKFRRRGRARKVQAAWQGRAEREDGGRRGRISEAGG